MQVRQVLEWGLSLRLCLYVCLSVIEIYRFTHSLHTSLARAAYDARSRSIEDSKGRRRQQNKSRCMKDG